MRIYLDDCADSNSLVAALVEGGHEIVSPREAGTVGETDAVHLERAVLSGCALLTKNPADFLALHDEYAGSGRSHFGILLVYQDRHRSKDMSPAGIVHAIRNLTASGISIENDVHNLNHWR
jgi:hypothetical protein